jgi:3-oxoacyl-[acyl-carrier-protein] synthase-3
MTSEAGVSGGGSAVLAGLGAWVPPRVVTNDELAARLDTSDEWIRARTGIAVRHLIDPGMTTCDLATHAGALALKSADDASVDAVIVATTTPDRLCPGTAPEVAARLGLSGIAAHDVQAVCSGFLYGLASAAGFIAAGIASRVLVIGAETLSTITNPADRTTAAILADGAGAVVLRAGDATEPGAIGPIGLGSDGENSDLIQIPAGGARQRSAGAGTQPEDHYFQMSGRQVYRHAVERLTASAHTAATAAGWTMADVDRLVMHQANARISAAVTERLGLDTAKVLSNIEYVGNTSAASIPLLLAQAAADGRLAAGHRVLLAAFGGGLTWGATTLTWPEITVFAEGGGDASPSSNPM